jgi:hypothetical protein
VSAVAQAGLRSHPYDAPVLEYPRPGSRLPAGAAVASGTLLAAACGSSPLTAG